MKEIDIAKPVIDYVKEFGWEVYQEVFDGRKRADIVAVRKNLVWVIEAKKSFSMSLLSQALYWSSYANYVSVAIPQPYRWTSGWDAGVEFCRIKGIGIFFTRDDKCKLHIGNTLNRKASTNIIKKYLFEEQKDYAEAGSSGKYWTPFKATCREVKLTVLDKPGITMKELIESINHHYCGDSTAKSCLRDLILKGVVEGVRAEYQGRKIFIYPEAA